MNLKLKTITLIILATSLGIALAKPTRAESNTIYVCASGCDFQSIQAAIEAANPGDTVIVKSGIYTESIKITKDHLIIKSESGSEKTIIRPPPSSPGFLIKDAKNVTIVGFSIEGAKGTYSWVVNAGILVETGSNCNISNNYLSGNEAGINVRYTSSCIISDNNFTSNKIGILLAYSSNNTIRNNVIARNNDGIVVAADNRSPFLCFDNKIINNRIKENFRAFSFSWCGGYNFLTKNEVIKNHFLLNFWITGIYLYLNNFRDNDNLVEGGQGAIVWHSPQKINYSYNGISYENYLGNYWSNYKGTDSDKNGIGDNPYEFFPTPSLSIKDDFPLIESFENYFSLQKWKFENEPQLNLDENPTTSEGKGYVLGNVYLLEIEQGVDALKIEGRISVENDFLSQALRIYLIATDGMSKEITSTTIPFHLFSYSQIDEKIYSFSFSLLNPPKPTNYGHYEIYLEIENNPFFINTSSKINKNYLPLIYTPEKMILISEVYSDVLRNKEEKGNNEWVMIHNLEKEPVEISRWQICDNEKCDEIPTSSIPANGFAIITPATSTFSFWKIPNGMTRIILGNKFGSHGLANEGDRVILKDKEGNVVDAMSYGNDKTIFDNPPKAREGYSLLRDPPDKDTDTGEDFKESEPTIGKNHPPIPIISFSPKNPVKGVKVKFDASSSIDPDGEIVNFEWKIGTSTSTGTTTEFTFNENDEYQITLTVTDNDGAASSTSTTLKVEPFSFAIITDLHIGRGYPDYGNEGFDDEDNGEEYYLTQRLRNVVSWVNEHKENYSFKFLAVLGDIADTAEKSEFCKAKEILDGLEIPYIPIFGNHDVWPYTEKESATTTLGEDFFERIFWSTSSIPCENASSTRNFETLLREFNFERDMQNPKFKNFTFTFGGIHFIGLDFNSREKACETECGVKAEGVLHNETISWLREKLNKLGGKETVIILSHEPFAKPYSRGFYKDSVLQNVIPFPQGNFSGKEIEEINQILQNYENMSEGRQILGNFGGHIHGFEKLGKEIKFFGQFSLIDLYFDANWQYPSLSTVPVLTTEALMVGGNEKDLSNKGLIRIVKVEEKEKINFSDIEFKEPALNPYIAFDYKILPDKIFPCVRFVGNYFSKREPAYFIWDFGDGEHKKLFPPSTLTDHCYSPLATPATYIVTFTVADKETGITESITRKIEIKEGIIPKIIKIGEDLKNKVELISAELGEQVTEFGRTMRDWIWVRVKHSPSTPVGLINVDFEEATGDIDLSQLKTDVDFQKKKSLLYMFQWPLEIERSKILFVPK